VTIDGAEVAERSLTEDVITAATIGAAPNGGLARFAWTPELAEVTEWVAQELERLGLDTEIDAAGNLLGRWPAPEGKAVMAASHLDTVPSGGPLDGALGVLGAVEAVRILRREGFEPARPIWIGAFMDEEGARFGTALFGSRAFVGEDLAEALEVRDRQGVSVREAMIAQGHDPERLGEAAQVDALSAYLELHIEQGPVLHTKQLRLGIVTSITGILGYRVTLGGEANHAGTTPIDLRRDALVGAARVIVALREEARTDPQLRATVGDIRVVPGATNVIPGRCEFVVDLRPAVADTFERAPSWLESTIERIAAEEGLEATIRRDYAAPPVPMDPHVTDQIRAAAREEQVDALELFSGAGHDAMLVARQVPSGMIFVPSRGGISHSPEEWTDPADCELGARVLAGALRRLAS
jgi:allantoate deiminase